MTHGLVGGGNYGHIYIAGRRGRRNGTRNVRNRTMLGGRMRRSDATRRVMRDRIENRWEVYGLYVEGANGGRMMRFEPESGV